MPDSIMLVQETTADEIWVKAKQVHAVSVLEAFCSCGSGNRSSCRVVIFAAVLVIF